MTETVHIAVAWNTEYGQPYFYTAEPGDTKGETGAYEVDVPADTWEDLEAARDAVEQAEKAIVDVAGFDAELGRMAECCAAWEGEEYGRRDWWSVQHDGQSVRSFDSGDAAERYIEQLPERFHLHTAFEVNSVERSDFTIRKSGFGGYSSDCMRCGWERDEHGGRS